MVILQSPEILSKAIESGNIWTILITIFLISVIPNVLNFITEAKRGSKFDKLISKQDQMINEQKEVNTHMLRFLDRKMQEVELNPNQITEIFEELLISAKQKLIEQVNLTLKMNNIKDKDRTKEKVSSYVKEILTDVFDKMFWFEYKGIKTGSVINHVWIKSIENQVNNFIYDNDTALKSNAGDKSKFYDLDILNRNLELTFKEFINTFNKKLQLLQSDIETKIKSYNE